MADHVIISQGSGATVSTDQIGAVHYQRIKVTDGTADSENHWKVDAAGSGQVALKGNVTIDSLPDVTIGSALPAGTNAIGKLAANSGVDIGDVDVTSNTAWADPNTFIGLVTVGNTVSTTFSGNVTLDKGSLTGLVGNVTIDSIGSTVNTAIIGNVTVDQVDTVTTVTAVTDITNPVALKGNLTIDSGIISLSGNVTLSDAKTFIGLVTAEVINGGTNKTLIHRNIELSTASLATLYVASNTWKATHLLINSNATVKVSIKSGATYLNGNASIGTEINPGGGWVENGSPDSPIYEGLVASDSIVIEKLDRTATIASVSGKIMFFDE